jgi:hypothetical protein
MIPAATRHRALLSPPAAKRNTARFAALFPRKGINTPTRPASCESIRFKTALRAVAAPSAIPHSAIRIPHSEKGARP